MYHVRRGYILVSSQLVCQSAKFAKSAKSAKSAVHMAIAYPSDIDFVQNTAPQYRRCLACPMSLILRDATLHRRRR